MPPRTRGQGASSSQAGTASPAANDKEVLANASVTRLTVNIGPATAEALEHVVEREGVTITEALRRLVGYGFVLYKTIKTDNKDVLIRSGNETQQVLIP